MCKTICMYFVSPSWNEEVRVLGVIQNDEKSVWLVGEENGEVQIGFNVSFTQRL